MTRSRGASWTAALVLCVALPPAAEKSYRLARSFACPPYEEGRFDLYAVGDSTVAGQPHGSSRAFPVLAARLLGRRLAGRPIKLYDLSASRESLYPRYVALDRALLCRPPGAPGAVLIYSGHNDASFPGNTSGMEVLKLTLMSRSLLLRDFIIGGQRRDLLPYRRTWASYEFFLRRAVETSLAHGLTPILATAVSDEADIPPGVFAHKGRSRASLEAALEPAESLPSNRFSCRMVQGQF